MGLQISSFLLHTYLKQHKKVLMNNNNHKFIYTLSK